MSFNRNILKRHRLRGLTLVELTLALVIVAILSIAVTTLLAGASNTNLFINDQTQAMAQVETAYRRIMHNVRTASVLSSPSNSTPTNTLTIQTQPDPGNSNNPWTITYSLSGGNLVENDPRYNGAGSTPNVLVNNVATFSITKSATSNPTTITLTIITSTNPPLTRTATIDCRNF